MVGPSRMTLASDRSLGRNSGPREIQRTLRVGVGGATGRVSREQSNRIGVALALKAAGTHPHQGGRDLLFEQKRSAPAKRYARLGTKYYVLGPPARVKRIRVCGYLCLPTWRRAGKRFRQGRGVPPPVVYLVVGGSRAGSWAGGGEVRMHARSR